MNRKSRPAASRVVGSRCKNSIGYCGVGVLRGFLDCASVNIAREVGFATVGDDIRTVAYPVDETNVGELAKATADRFFVVRDSLISSHLTSASPIFDSQIFQYTLIGKRHPVPVTAHFHILMLHSERPIGHECPHRSYYMGPTRHIGKHLSGCRKYNSNRSTHGCPKRMPFTGELDTAKDRLGMYANTSRHHNGVERQDESATNQDYLANRGVAE